MSRTLVPARSPAMLSALPSLRSLRCSGYQNMVLSTTTFCTAQHGSIILSDGLRRGAGTDRMSTDKVEAVERALAVLDAFHADRAAMTLSEIASATGFYKSTILRLAGSLERLGYLI